MKVTLLLAVVSYVAGRPEVSGDRRHQGELARQAHLEAAALPSSSKRSGKEREVYSDGAEIPVHLVYEQGEESEAMVKEVTNGKTELLNRGAREEEGKVTRRIKHYQALVPRMETPLWTTFTDIVEYGEQGFRRRRRDTPRDGPSIVRLKVRRGGVAIAGPGGVATAGSGGTAIVGPGGTAYTTPDGTAVVGPGGRLIEVPQGRMGNQGMRMASAGSGGTAIVGPGGTAYTSPDGTAIVGPGGRLIEVPYMSRGRTGDQGRLVAMGPVVYYPVFFN